MDGVQLHAFRESVMCDLPVPLLGVLLGAPQGSPFLEAPSPKGSLNGEESEGAAGAPHASSVPPGAVARQGNGTGKLNEEKTVIHRLCQTF